MILMMTDADELVAPYESITLARGGRIGATSSLMVPDQEDDFGWRGPAALETISIEEARRDQHEASTEHVSMTMGAPLVQDNQFDKSVSSSSFAAADTGARPLGDTSFAPMLDDSSLHAELLDTSRHSLGGADILLSSSMLMGESSLAAGSTSAVVAFPDPVPVLPTSLAVRPAAAATAGETASHGQRVRVDGRTMIMTRQLEEQLNSVPESLMRPEADLAPTTQQEVQQIFHRQSEIDTLFSNPALGLASELGNVFQNMMHLPITDSFSSHAPPSSIMGSPTPFDRSSLLPDVEEFRGAAVDVFPSSLIAEADSFRAAGAEQIGGEDDSFIAIPPGDLSKGHSLLAAEVVVPSQMSQTDSSQREREDDEQEGDDDGGRGSQSVSSSQRPSSYTNRTHQVLRFLRSRAQRAAETLDDDGEPTPLMLNPILQGRTRTVAANTFFELLVLNSRGSINLVQPSPYSDVTISIAPKVCFLSSCCF